VLVLEGQIITDPEIVPGVTGAGVTVNVLPADVAVLLLAHNSDVVRITVTTSPFANVLPEYVDPVPTFVPFSFH
jgi:hypothetical protein